MAPPADEDEGQDQNKATRPQQQPFSTEQHLLRRSAARRISSRARRRHRRITHTTCTRRQLHNPSQEHRRPPYCKDHEHERRDHKECDKDSVERGTREPSTRTKKLTRISTSSSRVSVMP